MIVGVTVEPDLVESAWRRCQLERPDVTVALENSSSRIIRHPSDHAALVIARQDCGSRALGLVFLGLAFGYAEEKERQGFKKVIFRQNFAVHKLHRVFLGRLRGIR